MGRGEQHPQLYTGSQLQSSELLALAGRGRTSKARLVVTTEAAGGPWRGGDLGIPGVQRLLGQRGCWGTSGAALGDEKGHSTCSFLDWNVLAACHLLRTSSFVILSLRDTPSEETSLTL